MTTQVGFVGLGNLGLPLAVAIASRGYTVWGYDAAPDKMRKRPYEHKEAGPDGDYDANPDAFQTHFDHADLRFAQLKQVMEESDVVFVAVQTPHAPRFEGVSRLPWERSDFDYQFLRAACQQVAKHRKPDQVVCVVSTVLPGTMRREILPILPGAVYGPAFPAMGTVLRDFLYPEFVLLGGDDRAALERVGDFYREMLPPVKYTLPLIKVSVESAELAKVAYNTYVSAKISIINLFQEIAHRTPGCHIDEVSAVLTSATRRVASGAYLWGGVGDGGACLTGDTLVNTDRGLWSIKDLAERGQDVAVWTFDGKKVQLARAVNVRKTQTNAKVVEVIFRYHGSIRCTPDHRFMQVLPTAGREVEAQNLTSGVVVCALSKDTTYPTDGYGEVYSVEDAPGLHDVYCMEVPATGWFFANNVLVHNCHPRDNIAMSWLAEKLKLSSNLFDDVMRAREHQAEWLVRLFMTHGKGMRLVVLGKSYKPESNITTGSCALLMANLLRAENHEFCHYDPLVDGGDGAVRAYNGGPSAYLIATKHECFKDAPYPEGSVIVDPFRFIEPRPGVKVVPVGIGR